jgi:hypothetical protein
MSILTPSANGSSWRNSYPMEPRYGSESKESVGDHEGEALKGASAPPMSTKCEKRNLELRSSVMALAGIFCKDDVASENWPKVFQVLHEVYREVSTKEWESIFDGRTPLSTQKRDDLRLHVTGEAFNRSFSVYPPPTDHPVVLRLNQVKWELFASNEEVVVAEQLSVSDIALERTPESDVTKADIVGTNDCSASLESLTMPENRSALPENSSHTGEGRVEAEIKGEEGLGDQEEPSKEVMVSNDPVVEGALLPQANHSVEVVEGLSDSLIASDQMSESDVTKADIVGTNDCSASLESLTMPENRNALPENSSHTGEGRVEAGMKGEEGLGDQEEPSKEVMVSNDPVVEGALLPQATSSALTNPTMDETTSAGSNKRKEEQIRGESKSDAETAPQNNIKAYNNVKAYIKKYGHDEDFIPSMVDLPGTPEDELYLPTEAPAGTRQKVAVLRKRVKLGQHLWHPNDRVDYEGIRENLARAKVR